MNPLSEDGPTRPGSSSYRWDPIGSSHTSLKGEQATAAVADKQTASQAVAFVVQNSRRGVVHLCAQVANLMKAKNRLELLVHSLGEENTDLKLRLSYVHSDKPLRPSPPSQHSMDYPPCLSRSGSKSRSLRCTRLRAASPSPSTSTSTSLCGETSTLSPTPHSTNSSGRTKNRSSRCNRLRPASISTSTLASPEEEICRVPLSPPDVHPPSLCDPPNSAGAMNRSFRCTERKYLSSSPPASSLPSPVSGELKKCHPFRNRTTKVAGELLSCGEETKDVTDTSSSDLGRPPGTGNIHTVTVEVHHHSHASQDQMQVESSQGNLVCESKAVSTDPCSTESVSIQCAIGETEASNLKAQIEKIEKEKDELGSHYRKIKEEMDRLQQQLKVLRDAKEDNEKPALHLKDTMNGDEKVLTKCNFQERATSPLLPLLSEHHSDHRASVKSLKNASPSRTIHVGDTVVIKGDLKGRVRYIGPLKHLRSSPVFAGIHLEAAVGHHEGVLEGYRYFRCPANHGILIPVQDIRKVITSKFYKRPRTAFSSLNKVSPYSIPQTITPSKGRYNNTRMPRTSSRITVHLERNSFKKC